MRCDIRQIPSNFGQFRNGSPTPPSTPFLAEWAEIFSPWNLPPDAQKLHRLPNWSTAAMEKTIAPWSYWLGITSVIVAIAWKGGNIFGLWRALPPTPSDISYWSFFNASLLFFAASAIGSNQGHLRSLRSAPRIISR